MSMKKAPFESELSKSALFLAFFLFVELALCCSIVKLYRFHWRIRKYHATASSVIVNQGTPNLHFPKSASFALFILWNFRIVGKNITFKAFFQRFFLHPSSPTFAGCSAIWLQYQRTVYHPIFQPSLHENLCLAAKWFPIHFQTWIVGQCRSTNALNHCRKRKTVRRTSSLYPVEHTRSLWSVCGKTLCPLKRRNWKSRNL